MKASLARITMLVTLALASLGVRNAQANSITFVTSRAALGGNDLLNWAVLGPPPPFTVSQPFVLTTPGGITVTGTAGASLQAGILECPVSACNEDFNFGPGDSLLLAESSGSSAVSLTLDFSTPIAGAGLQLEPDFPSVNLAYTGEISAFDGTTLLGSFQANGIINVLSFGDNSALFLGVKSTSADITSITFDSPNLRRQGILFNQLSLVDQPSSATPEPASLLLLGSGLIGLATRLRRAKKNPD